MELQEIQARLDEIYSLIPDFDCKGCGRCCGPINWRVPEGMVIKKYMQEHGIEHVVWSPEDYEKHDLDCPYLRENKCVIYPVRPLVCRLQGHVKKLRCPYHNIIACEHCGQKFPEIEAVNKFIEITADGKHAVIGKTVTCPKCHKTTGLVHDEKYGDIPEPLEEQIYRMIFGLEKEIIASYSR